MSRPRKILFLGGVATLASPPSDVGLAGHDAIALAPRVIPSLLELRDAGFELVLVGQGYGDTPCEVLEARQRYVLGLLESQGIRFSDVLAFIDNGAEAASTCPTASSPVFDYLRAGRLDFGASACVGAREADMTLARALGVRGFLLDGSGQDWPEIAHLLSDAPRIAEVERTTQETRVRVRIDLDREAPAEVATGIGFLDHMLEQLGRHGGFALKLTCAGDTHIDEHHTVEDSALALGQALRQALGDKRGIARYGFVLPMDESRAEALLDFSGRPYFVFEGRFPREQVGGLPTELVPHFFRSLAEAAGANLHLRVDGENAHHMVEACFKSVARALRQAIRREGTEVPSTKGSL